MDPEDLLRAYKPTTRCGLYLGQRQNEERLLLLCQACTGCNGFTCARCGIPVFQPGHNCVVPDPITAEALEETLKPQERGKDYQICPDEECLRPVALRDGCNQIECLCGQSLCFLCGEAVERGDGHWSLGKPCSRFGQPDDETSMWDMHPGAGQGAADEPSDGEAEERVEAVNQHAREMQPRESADDSVAPRDMHLDFTLEENDVLPGFEFDSILNHGGSPRRLSTGTV